MRSPSFQWVVNSAYTAQQSKYSYHVVMDNHVEQRYSALVKYNLETGKSERHDFPDGVYGSEPAFGPRDHAITEDDGFVVTFVTDKASGNSEALVIDAQNFTAPPVARIQIPQRIPAGFHGVWAAA